MRFFQNGKPTVLQRSILSDIFPSSCMLRLGKMLGEDRAIYYRGMTGFVHHVDDSGQLWVSWRDGGSLGVNLELDEFQVFTCKDCGFPITGGTGVMPVCYCCGKEYPEQDLESAVLVDGAEYIKKHFIGAGVYDSGLEQENSAANKCEFAVVKVIHTPAPMVEHLEVRREDGSTVELFAYPGGVNRQEWRFFYPDGKVRDDPDFEKKVLRALK